MGMRFFRIDKKIVKLRLFEIEIILLKYKGKCRNLEANDTIVLVIV